MTETLNPAGAAEASPLDDFSNCHVGILGHLKALGDLPALLEPATRARLIAQQALDFFRAAVFEHHQEEERELFPAVAQSAQPGTERAHVTLITDRLTREHREIEALWKQLEPGLKKVAKGEHGGLDSAGIHRLIDLYGQHAGYEEAVFLPLSRSILGRNSDHLAALGLSLHMRHLPPLSGAYI